MTEIAFFKIEPNNYLTLDNISTPMNIILISTRHKEIGKCNADELCGIIEKIRPEVIFLEALHETYSSYDTTLLSFGIYHRQLEIKALQKYGSKASFTYVPVLDSELSEALEEKFAIVCENRELQKLIDNYNSLVQENGFEFLNSDLSVMLHEEMRILECRLMNGNELSKVADKDVDEYENSMLRNIYSYSKDSEFNTAIFMCGSAHRKSIIEKIKAQEEATPNWTFYSELK